MNRTRINRGHTNHSSGKLRVRTRSTFAINLTRGRANHSSGKLRV